MSAGGRCRGCDRLIVLGDYCCHPCVVADGGVFMHTASCQDRYHQRMSEWASRATIEDEELTRPEPRSAGSIQTMVDPYRAVRRDDIPTCTCPMLRDTGGFRIADLGCPTHGVGGTDPGDGR